MPASWVAVLLLVVAQSDGEVPQRLPPLPAEFLSTAPNATLPVPAFPNEIAPAPAGQEFAQQEWPASPPQLEDRLILPPPGEISISASIQPLYDVPAYEEELAQPGTRLSFAMLGAGTGFGMTSFDLNHTWLLGYGDGPPLNIMPGFGMHLWTDPGGEGLPPRVFDLYLDFLWVPLKSELWSISVGLTPGLYGDFAQASGNTFQLTGWIVGNRQFGPHWQLLLGMAYVRQLQSNILPVGGLIWTPNENVRLELIIPKPKCAVRFRENSEGSLWWYVAGQLGGGAWAVADTPNDNALVGYSDLRATVGVESFLVDGREWSVEIGYVFGRNLYIDNQPLYSPENTFCLSASIAY